MGHKTYWHFRQQQKMPTSYELLTTQIAYHTSRRQFEVQTPGGAWMEQYLWQQIPAELDWEHWHDPRELTYVRYTQQQAQRTQFVQKILENCQEKKLFSQEAKEKGKWTEEFCHFYSPMLHALHGLQMLAAYVAQMSPSSPIIVAYMFQAADEMRRIETLGQTLQRLVPDGLTYVQMERLRWQEHPAWQKLREVLEKMLATYSWPRAWAGLNLCLKPAMDELLLKTWPAHFTLPHGEHLWWQEICYSLWEDCVGHRQVTAELQHLMQKDPQLQQQIQETVEFWNPLCGESCQQLQHSWEYLI